MALLSAENIHKSFPLGSDRLHILTGVNLEIDAGEIVALMGPSGSGKSTIARLIASLWDVSSGSILLGDTDIRAIPQEAYSDKIAFVFVRQGVFQPEQQEFLEIKT